MINETINEPEVIENGPYFFNTCLAIKDEKTYLFNNLHHFEIFENVILLYVHHKHFLFLNQLSVLNQLQFFE